jgi:hypothetical protein
LVQDFSTGIPWQKDEQKTTWKTVALKYFGCEDPETCYFSAVDMAKMWILGTDGMNNTTQPNEPRAQGGCNSCVSTTAVALQEGGNMVGSSSLGIGILVPDSYPRNMWDPTFSTKICKENEKCINGGPWQVSSAWVSADSCPDCSNAGCRSLENPLCAAKISMWHAIGANKWSPSCLAGTQQCTAAEMQKGVDPNCYFGPFGLCSMGWNSPTCSQLYRRAWAITTGINAPTGYNTFGRIAINACNQAKIELENAGWKSVQGACNVVDPFVNELEKDHTDGSGDWGIDVPTNPCMCGTKACYSSEP